MKACKDKTTDFLDLILKTAKAVELDFLILINLLIQCKQIRFEDGFL